MENFSILTVSLDNINKCINKIKNLKISEFGIRSSHFDCMMHIDLSADGLTPTEISKNCGVDKAFVSRTTADLIKGGFIQTNQKYNDGRKYRNKYILTEKGKKVIMETRALLDKYFSDLGGRISEYDMKCFWRVMLTISDAASKKTKDIQ